MGNVLRRKIWPRRDFHRTIPSLLFCGLLALNTGPHDVFTYPVYQFRILADRALHQTKLRGRQGEKREIIFKRCDSNSKNELFIFFLLFPSKVLFNL